jgi:Cu(I)/Ag(I) efflux system membrane protein CusA/SilA
VRWLFLALLLAGIVACGMTSRTRLGSAVSIASLIVVALIAHRTIRPLQHDLITPLSEGMVMDMPITVPLMGIAQSVDDLKARDMVLCRFPEVSMVVGKSGRAETPTDPAPLDMIETMVDFRPEHLWPRRKLRQEDAERHSLIVLNELIDRELIASPGDEAAREAAANAVVGDALARFDGLMREYAYQRNDEFSREVGSQLKRFVVERCVELLWQRGRLTRRPSASDIALIASEVPGEIGQILQSGSCVRSPEAWCD